jgi:[pyruvate, water dikinase]-phosphate phosphotransferase / [pyruvate, water dikinase] kinase
MGRNNASSRSTVLVLSDSTGNLGRHMLTAVLTQFPLNSINIRYENFIRTQAQLDMLLDNAVKKRAAVCHAMVSDRLKQRINETCAAAKIHCFDLTGGLVQFLARSTGVKPDDDVRSLHRLDAAYHRRIGAMEFTLCHDDGLGLETLHEADIVLVGVSRTSKTPTSVLLAQQGYRAANVSLAKGIDPPSQLLALSAKKVVAMAINPEQLAIIRGRREAVWGMSRTDYGNPKSVAEEVKWSRALFRSRGWPVLDVTDQAVEETAAKIVELVGPVHQEFTVADAVLDL